MTTAPNTTITPYRYEPVLGAISLILGTALWVVIAISIVGLFYGAMIGLFVFFVQLMLIAHLRGNAIKLGEQQMPELYRRVVLLAQRIGLKKVPDVYVMQANGVLNAFATRFGSRNFLVLHSEIVQACGDNHDALDFVIGHELGHLHRGHLRWQWLRAPALLIPLLGSAYARAREYSCDRYGAAACADLHQGSTALCILVAGACHAGAVNKQAFIDQAADLDTVFMQLGGWFSHYPHLAHRLHAIEPTLTPSHPPKLLTRIVAGSLITLLVLAWVGILIWSGKQISNSLSSFLSERLDSMPPALSSDSDAVPDADKDDADKAGADKASADSDDAAEDSAAPPAKIPAKKPPPAAAAKHR